MISSAFLGCHEVNWNIPLELINVDVEHIAFAFILGFALPGEYHFHEQSPHNPSSQPIKAASTPLVTHLIHVHCFLFERPKSYILQVLVQTLTPELSYENDAHNGMSNMLLLLGGILPSWWRQSWKNKKNEVDQEDVIMR